MTSNPGALLPSAKEVMQKIALAETEEAEKHARMLAEAQAEKKHPSITSASRRASPTRRRSPAGSRSSSARLRLG